MNYYWTVVRNVKTNATRGKLVPGNSAKSVRKQLKAKLIGTEWELTYVEFWDVIPWDIE